MRPWRLSNEEWCHLRPILLGKQAGRGRCRGRPRANQRMVAEACLFRYYHSLGPRNRSFGWRELPDSFGVSPVSAHRRFQDWTTSGAWYRFWEQLLKLRGQSAKPIPLKSPVCRTIAELERAFSFFNARFFANTLPASVIVSLEHSLPADGVFCPRKPRHWIAIHSRTLARGPDEVLGVLLHEMVHVRNHECGLPDVHRGYHNQHFRDTAATAGLLCSRTRKGYTPTRLGPHALAAVAAFRPKKDVLGWPEG